MISKEIKIYTDGGARGNPGPAGIGVVIKGGQEVKKYSQYIGEATNNQAEYQAVIFALKKAKQLGAKEIEFYLDSELAVNQLNQKYKIKDKKLGSLFVQAWNLSQNFARVEYFHIPREENKEADQLVNLAIDDYLANK